MDLEILRIASNTENHKVINNCTHISKQKNPLCGDEMEISLIIKNNKIVEFGYQSKSCIYCEATVSLLSRKCINKPLKKIKEIVTFALSFFETNEDNFQKEWNEFNSIFHQKNISRKECLKLPFKTLSKAIEY
tara:strand:- start:472 stop:870 length:399 start_codon:yes stop_codon:yes gene_type:complete